MKAKLSWALLALCLWSTCQAAPKKNNNKKISDDNSDLIPIPDHLLETYLPSGKFQKTDGKVSNWEKSTNLLVLPFFSMLTSKSKQI